MKKVLLTGIILLQAHMSWANVLQGTVKAVGTLGYGNSTPTVTSTTGAAYNATAKTLSHDLSSVVVSLTMGGAGGSLQYTFDSTVISHIPASVIQNGLYVGVNVAQISTKVFPGLNQAQNSPGNKITAYLSDQSGTIYASASFTAPKNVSTYQWYNQGVPNGVFYYQVNTAKVTFTDSQGNTTSVTGMSLSGAKRVYFKGTGGSKQASAASAGTSEILATGETLSSLELEITFSNGDKVSLPFVAAQLTQLNKHFTSGKKGVVVSLNLDSSQTHYSATVHVVSHSQQAVSGFPLDISATNFKTSGGQQVPTSGNTVSHKKIIYKTSNMQQSLSIITTEHSFDFKESATVLKSDHGSHVTHHAAKSSSGGADSAGGRF